MPPPIVTLLTDFGYTDPYVGIMKGVILSICPEARLVDLTHGVQPYAVRQAAFLLDQAWPHFPPGTIHLAVVDPGVGTSRRPLLLEAGGHYFVGPDNGLFSNLSPTAIYEIEAPAPASRTFHGRDVFAPAAARLAKGFAISSLANPAEALFQISASSHPLLGNVLHVDHFGNVVTSFRPVPGIRIQAGETIVSRHARTYADSPPDELFLIEGSSGYLEIALNQASAAQRLGIGINTVLRASI